MYCQMSERPVLQRPPELQSPQYYKAPSTTKQINAAVS